MVGKTRDSTTVITYEWEMKNFSTQFNPQSPEVENPNIQEEKAEQHIEEERARCDWEFNLPTVVTSSSAGASTDTIGVIEFDPSDSLVATGESLGILEFIV